MKEKKKVCEDAVASTRLPVEEGSSLAAALR